MAARRWDVVVVGGANTDFLVRGPDLPAAGQTIDGAEFQAGPGGKGANQAVAAAPCRSTCASPTWRPG
jgi:ribokinase